MLDAATSQINYVASQPVRDVIASLSRTEDARFSPDGRRLAVAGYGDNSITVFGISIAKSGEKKKVILNDATEISSAHLNHPHGLDFVDNDKLIVANREGIVCIFELPKVSGSYRLDPIKVLLSEDIKTPGSVAAIRTKDNVYEALICNNYVHTVTRHRLDFNAGGHSRDGYVLLEKGLDVPDGICVSKESKWIAVSNHNTHTVLIYNNSKTLNKLSDPDCVLRGIDCPHGVRFSSDNRLVLVAHAAAPYVSVYQQGDSGWRGVRDPVLSFRVLTGEDFLRGRHNVEEGGPKGIDIDDSTNVVVATCETQPLAFFDLDEILGGALASTVRVPGRPM
jgi:WD40 repeat protein